MMRSVSFVDRLELDFSGNHFSDALALGDVDADGVNELVIGNVDGVLAVFKGPSTTPLKKCSGLGTIVCVGIGDVLNTGKNVVVCVNSDGECSLFDITTPSTPGLSKAGVSSSPEQQRRGGHKSMRALHSQSLSTPNVKTLCVAPLSSEGDCDLLLGHTDRCVSVYRWSQGSKALCLLHTASLSGQVGSLSVSSQSSQLLVSQPGGTYLPLAINLEGELESRDLIGQPQRRNPTSSTSLVANIVETVEDSDDIVALCTLDGTVRMVRGGVKQWELQVDHSLFSIQRLDITGSGCDEIVTCAWDGMTYVVDLNRNIVRYKFEQNVTAFAAGCYGLEASNEPCLVYTTFSNRVYIYHNIQLPAVPSFNLVTARLDTEEGWDDETKQRTFRDILYRQKQE
ncbi:KICSTOR complex protein ITFG2-like isoform X2 [Halichondria panicea]|uniref:KICSTOR complex protein ITFG2-like isoform X2 n=1 Tax=Halichondria panicea TaxID=6063 RepID=UPI00312BA07B